jgi:DNA-binding SARP family transcriptional activator
MDAGVRLLGPPAVRAGGTWIALRPTKPHALLAYVAHRRGCVRRAELAALLWPEADARHAGADVRQALSSLARGPFGALVGRDRDGVWLDAESDFALFCRAVVERRWPAALDLHGGPLLEGFEVDGAEEFSAWLAGERTAVADEWRRACRALAREASAAGRHDDALALADRVLRVDPIDEVVAREAMAAAVAAGDTGGARRRYLALERTLERELGVAPEPATQALHERLVVARGPPAPPPRVGRPPKLVGRERALSDLVALLRRSDVRLVTLVGPAGIGATTLAEALVADFGGAFRDGVVVVRLEGIAGPDAVARALARAAHVALEPSEPTLPQVRSALAARRALVFLDGFEGHLAEVATVGALLRGTVDPRLLVTARRPLGLADEQVVHVAPLATAPVAPRAGALSGPTLSPAAELFLHGARRRLPPLDTRGLDVVAVEHIAALLHGHPLAIELAAAWIDVGGLEGLGSRLRVRFPNGPCAADLDRGTPVRALLDEVWQRLAPGDRAAWARLAVLPGSLDRVVARDVAGTGWRGLRRLIDRAVLRRRGDRLELHGRLRCFGRERAAAEGLVEPAWRAATGVWRTRIAQEFDPCSGRRLPVHPHDLEQVLGVWARAVDRGDVAVVADLVRGLVDALRRSGRGAEGAALVRGAVARLRAEPAGPARDLALMRAGPLLTGG